MRKRDRGGLAIRQADGLSFTPWVADTHSKATGRPVVMGQDTTVEIALHDLRDRKRQTDPHFQSEARRAAPARPSSE